MGTQTEHLFVTGAMGSPVQPAGIRPAAQAMRPAPRDMRHLPEVNSMYVPACPIRASVIARLRLSGIVTNGKDDNALLEEYRRCLHIDSVNTVLAAERRGRELEQARDDAEWAGYDVNSPC